MNYQIYQPHPDLESLVKFYWTLEVPPMVENQRQRIIPSGCLEMAFILGDDIKRYTSEDEFVIQPRSMVLGQITEPFYIEPTGYVKCFAVCFYPFGLANLLSISIKDLTNKETPLTELFGEESAHELEQKICDAEDTESRITIIENFLFKELNNPVSIDNIVKTTIDTMFFTRGAISIREILKNDSSKRRQLERKFTTQVGISPKQLCKVIRLQTVLKVMLNQGSASLSQIAYNSEYYDQAHFTKDFKEFTGMTPREFFKFDNREMALSLKFYK